MRVVVQWAKNIRWKTLLLLLLLLLRGESTELAPRASLSPEEP
jgi:hypothetical protein